MLLQTSVAFFLLSLLVIAADPGVGSTGGLTLVWENRGQPEPSGAALAVDVAGDVVVASGNVCTGPGVAQCNWFVRAMDATIGSTVWEDRLNVGAFDRSQGVVIAGDAVFASGWFQTASRGFDFVVRAYSRREGTILWQQQIHRGGGLEFAETIAAHANLVFAVGRVLGSTRSSDFSVFAFDARTGELVWERVIDLSGLRLIDVAFAAAAQGDRLFAVGPADNFTALLVRAFDARTGQTVWQDRIANGSQFVKGDTLAAHGDLLVVGGAVVTAGGTQDLLVRAYDQVSGATRWTHQEDAGGNDEVFAVHIAGSRVFAVGGDACDEFFLACSFATRALDLQSGSVLWQDRFQDAAGGDAFAIDVTTQGNFVAIGGMVQNEAGEYEWMLRAHAAATGSVLADERLGGVLGGVNSLAGSGERMHAAGFLGRADGGIDFTVRTYNVRVP